MLLPRTAGTRRLVLAAAVLVLAVGLLATPGAAESPTDLTVDDRTAHLGDVVELSLAVGDEPSNRTIALAADDGNYSVTVRVVPTNRSEPMRLAWNTHYARDAHRTYGLSGRENVRSIEVVDASGELLAGVADHLPAREVGWNVTIAAYGSPQRRAAGDPDSETSVHLAPLDITGFDLWTVPGVDQHRHDDGLGDLLAERTEVDANRDRYAVAEGDLLLIRVEVGGVHGALDGSLEQFHETGLSIYFDSYRHDIDLQNATLRENASIVWRPEEDAIYLAVDVRALPDVPADDDWRVSFDVAGWDNPYLPSNTHLYVTRRFYVEDRRIELTGNRTASGRLALSPTDSPTVTAETNVAPGTNATVRVSHARGNATARTEVGPNGTIAADLDLSGLERGARLDSVRVRAPGRETEASLPGVVGQGSTPPQFAVDVDAPTQVPARGPDGNATVRVTNEGDLAGTADLEVGGGGFDWNGSPRLGPGETWSQTFELNFTRTAYYTVRAETGDSCDARVVWAYEYVSVAGFEPKPYNRNSWHYDFDGDGDLGHADVVEFFQHHFYDAVQNRSDVFDYSGNDRVGHGDVVRLFEVVTSGGADPLIDESDVERCSV